ncbi:MAG: DedA family protein [Chloroflexi bacterium]|nr:DedA family protein [Chloroflexota bacterium]
MIGHWVAGNGYTLLFILMLVEGPVVTAAAAFAAALGYMNIYGVFALSILGNLVPDAIYYAIGFWGRGQFVEKYGRYVSLTPSRVQRLEAFIDEHAGKSLVAIKLIPFLATPGLIVAGMGRMDIKRYALWSLIVTLPSSLLYLLVGYYSGAAYGRVIHDINVGGYIIAAAIVLFIVVTALQRKYGGRWAREIEGE